MRRWKIIADNLKKAGWTLAGFQLWIVTGDQSGLQTRNGEETGDGMLYTSVEDLQKWDENFYSAHVGRKDILAAMQEQIKVQGRELESAKGLFIRDYRGPHTVGYSGGSGGYH